MLGLNKSPGMGVRTLDFTIRGGGLGINNVQSTGSEQISRSGNVGGPDVLRPYNSQN